jgi:macrolide transport system ATP-binding/permease protein
MMPPLIQAVGLRKSYRTDGGEVEAVAGVDLEIHAGDFVAIVGPSGSGKSSLMNLIGLLDQPDSGSYRFADRDVTALDPDEASNVRNSEIGFVYQNFNLLERRTAVENVEMPLIYAGVDKQERQLRAMRALEQVGLGHRCDHWPHQLSGGEQQRVAIARALVTDPRLILADEPTGAIDSRTGEKIIDLLRALNSAGRTVVIVTHDHSIARAASRIITMQDGRAEEMQSQRLAGVGERPVTPADHERDDQQTAWMERSFINISESVAVALRALRANLMRSALTMLGVIVGVAAVITMVAVGSGANVQITDQIRSLGTNLLLITPGSADSGAVRLGAGTRATLTEADATAIASEIPGVLVAAPGISGAAQLVRGNRNWAARLGGVTPSYLIAREWYVERGRELSEEDQSSAAKVVVLGAETARQLFAEEDPVDQVIRIGEVPFTVIGVLAEKGQNSAAGRNQDDVALLPLSTTKLRVSSGYSQLNRLAVEYVLVKVADSSLIDAVTGQISALLRQRHRIASDLEDDFEISDPAATIRAQAAATRSLSLLLAAVSSVSLIVGGISIMNIMLVSVSERTREIGIRLAVGARRRDLRAQFVIEALVLCLVGGIAGLLVGIFSSWSIASIAGWPVFVGPSVILLAVGSASLIGVFFGFYPAAKASSMRPIDALRFE